MPGTKFTVKGKVWLYGGEVAWHFVSVPKKESQLIRKYFIGLHGGFGSFKVYATVGQTTWKTSIFPESKTGNYMLPLKAEVRKKEKILAGRFISFTIAILT